MSTNFWYYTSFDTANKILESKRIYIRNIADMNDNDESEMHKQDSGFIHCLCLCNSNTEKIPMWYLYAGITGKGVSLGFTRTALLDLIDSITEVTTPDKSVVLKRGADFEIYYGWIFYRKTDDLSKVMYRRKWYSLSEVNEFEKDNYFIKSYPWEYEKEFRIVIYNKTGKQYPQLAIKINDEVYKKLRIKFAPEFSKENEIDFILQSTGFKNFIGESLKKSTLGINMDLCKRNYQSFLDYINWGLKNENDDIETEKICKMISNAKKCNNTF